MEKLNQVARYGVDGYGRQDIHRDDENGEFVYYDDFEAMKQRAEAAEAKYIEVSDWYAKMKTRMLAAEAKLAELEKQEPVAVVDIQRGRGDGKKFALVYTGAGHALVNDVYHLFTRPAPAINLAELVPDKRPFTNDKLLCDNIENYGWNACRAAILRKIEEAK